MSQPVRQPDPTGASWRDLAAIYRLWLPQGGWLGIGLVVSLAAVASFVFLMGHSGATVAAALGGAMLAMPLGLRALGAARVVLRYGERLATHSATFRALAALRVWFFRGLAERAAGGLAFRRAADMLSRLVSDVEALDGLYLRIAIPAAAALLLLALLPRFLLPFGIPFAAAIMALFVLAAFVVPLLAARDAMRGAAGLAATAADLRIAALDLLGGLREARAFGAEDRLLAAIQAKETRHQRQLDLLSGQGSRANACSFLCGQGAILLTLLAAARFGTAAGPAAITLTFFAIAAFEAVSLLPRAGALAGHAAASAHRVRAIAAAPLAHPDPATPAPLPPGTALRFEAVHFSWDPSRLEVLDGLSLDIPRGSRVALLGASGAGKSTIAALALRVAVPSAGRITLGGTDIAQFTAHDLRSRFSWLSQSTHLFDDTIRRNLLLGRADATDDDLWEALAAARIADLVQTLPEGLDSWVGEAGARFSGGQARRLVLARALLSPAPILILDEPCAGLDNQTEAEFLATLNDIAPGRTLLLITHRLTGIEKLDRIYRLSAGRAVAAAG